MKKIFIEYRLELGVFIAGLLGLFLFVGRNDLGQSFQRVGQKLAVYLAGMYHKIENEWSDLFSRFALSDLLGWLLFLMSLAFIFWRIRHHFSHSVTWQATGCPRCGAGLQRIPRSSWDHFLSNTVLPGARRYRCTAADCGWSGLRQRRDSDRLRRHHSSSTSAD